MSAVMLGARILLAAVFAVAGIAKLFDLRGSRKSLEAFGVPGWLAKPLGILLPLAELACAAALIPDAWAWWGANGVLAMLALFIAGISVNLARGRAPDCHCFGQLSSSPVSWKTLVRNLVLLALAGLVPWKAEEIPLAWPAISGDTFETFVLVAIGTLAVGLALTVCFLFQILKQ